MTTHDIDIELPPLPRASKMYDIPGYDEEELKDYARAAIESYLKRRGEPVAWRWSESNGERWFDWTTDWSYHDRAAKMGCLIEYAAPSAPQPAEPVKDDDEGDMLTIAYMSGYHEGKKAAQAEQVKVDVKATVPSDAEIGQILKEVLHNSRYGVHQWELWLEFASALFTRYGGGTP